MRLSLFTFFFLISLTLVAQSVDLSSPYGTLHTLYENLVAEEPNVANASKVISSRHIRSKNKRQELIQELLDYIKNKEIDIDFSNIPTSEDYLDSATNRNYYELGPSIAVEKIGSQWYLTKETINHIQSLDPDDDAEVETPDDAGLLANRRDAQKTRQAELAKISQMQVDLSSPYSTMKFFLDNIDDDPAISSRIISRKDIPEIEDRVDIAEKLDRFLKGKGILIDLDNIPEDPDYTDSIHAGKYTYEISYRFSEIYLERDEGRWYLSKESAQKIPVLYKLAFPFGSDRLLQYIPVEGQYQFLGIYLWQYIALIIVFIVAYLVYRVLYWILSFLTSRTLHRLGFKEVTQNDINPTAKPLGLLLALLLVAIFMPFLQLPIKLVAFITVSLDIFGAFFATMAFFFSTDIFGLYLTKLARKPGVTFDEQIVPLLVKILKGIVVVVGAVLILAKLNVPITALLGTLSVGGLALALAAQDTIKNFFGSLMIFLDKPFQAGQWVTTVDGLDGTVEKVGFRSTRIRTFSNSVISVPNGRLSDNAVDNHGLRAYRRFKTHISVTYDTPPNLLELFIEGLREIVIKHPHTRKDYYHVYMNEMGSHSLNVLFYIFFITPEWSKELQYRHEVIISIMKLAETLGIRFAFPTQTLHMEDFPGQVSLSPNYDTSAKAKTKMKKFLEDSQTKQKDVDDE